MKQYVQIAGAQRCGTTSLWHLFRGSNPNVFFSNHKEPIFFDAEYWRGKDWYLDKFFNGHQGFDGILMSARAAGLMIHYFPERVVDMFPGAKAIIMLRHPYLRAYSSWLEYNSMRPGRWPWDWPTTVDLALKEPQRFYRFEGDWVPYIDAKGGTYHNQFVWASMYAWQVINWMHNFGRENVHIMFLEDVGKMWFLPDLYRFLGLDYNGEEFPHRFKGDRNNGSMTLQQHRVNYPSTMMRLYPRFQEDMMRLSSFLNIDLFEKWDLKL